jgi:hypothetical protein
MTRRSLFAFVAAFTLLLAPVAAQQAQAPALRGPDVIFVPTPQEVVDAMLKLANVTSKDVVYDLGSGDGRIPITAATFYGARAFGIDIDPPRIREANDNLAAMKTVIARLDAVLAFIETTKKATAGSPEKYQTEARAGLMKQFGLTDTQALRVFEMQLDRLTTAQRQSLKGMAIADMVRFLNQDLFTTDISQATVVTLYLLPSLNLKLKDTLNKQLKPGTRIVSHAFDMGDSKPLETLNVNGRTVYYWTIPIK